MEDSKKNQVVKIDEAKCFGCGVCQSICPEGFEVIGGKSRVKNANAECVERAIRACPVAAIALEQKKEVKPKNRN
jgi:ferredoxin